MQANLTATSSPLTQCLAPNAVSRILYKYYNFSYPTFFPEYLLRVHNTIKKRKGGGGGGGGHRARSGEDSHSLTDLAWCQ